MSHTRKPAVVLLSGGLDSATILAIAHQQNFDCYALSFSYGQRATVELRSAARVAAHGRCIQHRIADIDLKIFGGSALTDVSIAVPKDRIDTEESHSGAIPVTYVPARNTIFLSYALAWAEVLGSFDIFIGANAVDYSGYPDCRPEYIAAFEKMANLATSSAVQGQGKFTIHAPLLNLSKAAIISRGTELGVDYSITHSCYDPVDDLACGHCDACLLRAAGFKTAGIPDPTRYVTL